MKARLIRLLLYLIFVTGVAKSQSWQWLKGGSDNCPDQVEAICTDVNGNTYMLGSFGGSFLPGCKSYMLFDSDTVWGLGDNQLYLVKYSPSGNVLWSKSIGGNNPFAIGCGYCERSYSICYDSINNSVYLTGSLYGSATFGSTTLSGSGESFLTKLDVGGNFIWAKLYGTHSTTARVTTDLSGNVFLTGGSNDSVYFDSIVIPPGSFWAKLDPGGNAIWAKIVAINAGIIDHLIFAGNNIYALFVTSNDTAWIDTSLFISGSIHNNILAKFDSSGTIQWLTSYYSNATTYFFSIFNKDAAGNFYITGPFDLDIHFGSTTLTSQGASDFYFAKYDANGNFVWAEQGHATNGATTTSIVTSPDGSTYIGGVYNGNLVLGSFNISTTSNEIFIARYNKNGDCLGVLQMGAATQPVTISKDNSENLIVAATFNPPGYSLGGFTLNYFGGVFIAKHDVITGVEENDRVIKNQLLIYANPTAGKCKITLPDDFKYEENLVLSIYNSSGELIRQQKLEMTEGKISLNLEAEAKGLYNVILSNGHKNYSGKIVFE
ncbi:MAG: T9SS type A sorting domain-containing protein [Bacteroidia bacterium]